MNNIPHINTIRSMRCWQLLPSPNKHGFASICRLLILYTKQTAPPAGEPRPCVRGNRCNHFLHICSASDKPTPDDTYAAAYCCLLYCTRTTVAVVALSVVLDTLQLLIRKLHSNTVHPHRCHQHACLYGQHFQQSLDQPGNFANSARGQLNRKNDFPRSRWVASRLVTSSSYRLVRRDRC